MTRTGSSVTRPNAKMQKPSETINLTATTNLFLYRLSKGILDIRKRRELGIRYKSRDQRRKFINLKSTSILIKERFTLQNNGTPGRNDQKLRPSLAKWLLQKYNTYFFALMQQKDVLVALIRQVQYFQREQFYHVLRELELDNCYLQQRFASYFDMKGTGKISAEDLADGLEVLQKTEFQAKVMLFFHEADIERTGVVSLQEIEGLIDRTYQQPRLVQLLDDYTQLAVKELKAKAADIFAPGIEQIKNFSYSKNLVEELYQASRADKSANRGSGYRRKTERIVIQREVEAFRKRQQLVRIILRITPFLSRKRKAIFRKPSDVITMGQVKLKSGMHIPYIEGVIRMYKDQEDNHEWVHRQMKALDCVQIQP